MTDSTSDVRDLIDETAVVVRADQTTAVVRADTRHLPLPDDSVDVIVTSPPYWTHRDYQDVDGSLAGQIGLEISPAEYVAELIVCVAEWCRVLKPSGSLFVNLGDKYAGSAGGPGAPTKFNATQRREHSQAIAGTRATTRFAFGAPAKSLLNLPGRFAIAAVDDLGLIHRATIIWDKPNHLPESVEDRVQRSYEEIGHYTRQGRYYSAVHRLREPHRTPLHAPGNLAWPTERNDGDRVDAVFGQPGVGRIPGAVWRMTAEPLRVDSALQTALDLPEHFAAFPTELPRRLITGWSPEAICLNCGQGRRPVVHKVTTGRDNNPHGTHGDQTRKRSTISTEAHDLINNRPPPVIVGEACDCTPYTDIAGGPTQIRTGSVLATPPGNGARQTRGSLGDAERTGPRRVYHWDEWTPPPTRPAVVLDPFGGTGTTAGVARRLGRLAVSVDLSDAYSRLAAWRVFDSDHFDRVTERDTADRQLEMFAL